MSASVAARTFSGYRRLFRARKILFTGDVKAMSESRKAIKVQFEKNKHVQDSSHLDELFNMINEAEDMLLNGIARGELNDNTGRYGTNLLPPLSRY